MLRKRDHRLRGGDDWGGLEVTVGVMEVNHNNTVIPAELSRGQESDLVALNASRVCYANETTAYAEVTTGVV